MISVRAWLAATASVAVLVTAVFIPKDEQVRSRHTVTAIDYHFHDAHPTPPLTLDATLRFTNQGRSLHNVSLPDAGYSADLTPGEEIVIPRLREVFGEPGRYPLVCKYHADRGMTGVLTIDG